MGGEVSQYVLFMSWTLTRIRIGITGKEVGSTSQSDRYRKTRVLLVLQGLVRGFVLWCLISLVTISGPLLLCDSYYY